MKIIIIGAGFAGLSAGIYGRLSGMETELYEMHDKPGGLCTTWKRKGYSFDSCIHWLVGSNPKSFFHKVWDEIGVTPREFVDSEEFQRIRLANGKDFILYSDVDKFEKHMLEWSKEDEKFIKEFTNGIRVFSKYDLMKSTFSKLAAFTMLPVFSMFRKYGGETDAFIAKIKNPEFKDTFGKAFGFGKMPFFMPMMMMAWQNKKDGGYPIGGSLPMSEAIERRYKSLGGKVFYNSRIEKIITENGKAVGIKLADGTIHKADIIISAADGYATIYRMLEGKFRNDTIDGYYKNMKVFDPLVMVGVGAAKDFSKEPGMMQIQLAKPIKVEGKDLDNISIKHYCKDRTFAPNGKSSLMVFLNANYEYWKNLATDKEKYNAEKEDIGRQVVDAIDSHFPGTKQAVEIVDVSTPITLERYTGNWQGSIEGWQFTKDFMLKGMKKTLPGLASFYMCGQWVEPGGGLPTAVMSGYNVIKEICKANKLKFMKAKSLYQ